MAGEESSTLVVEELQALSQSLYQTHTARRTASLALPRSVDELPGASSPRPPSRRMSLSPWRSRPSTSSAEASPPAIKPAVDEMKNEVQVVEDKRGVWGWKPMRALSRIGMRRLGCLFSVEAVALHGLPASMNGLRLAVCVRKKETRDGAVQTMPARVGQGMAEFEETLFVRTNVYYSGGSGHKPLKFECRQFVIYVFAVDVEELDFGRSTVDLSLLIQKSREQNSQGERVREWDTSFNLSGKARGGELILKLGIQVMEDKGMTQIYNQTGSQLSAGRSPNSTSLSFVRRQSKASFSVQSPRRYEPWTPSKESGGDLRGIDELNLDEPETPVAPPPAQLQPLPEEPELPEFDVVDKGIEFLDEVEEPEQTEEEETPSASIEVVKEMIHNPEYQKRLTELDTIAQQIEALELLIKPKDSIKDTAEEEERIPDWLDAEEETVTREFLQLLEGEEAEEGFPLEFSDEPPSMFKDYKDKDLEMKIFVPDLSKGLLSVVQTRDGGFLAAMNPFDVEVSKKETPKLAMQISRPLVLPSDELSSGSGFELFQKMAGVGAEQLKTELQGVATMDELMGKTAEQIAFEGIASAIIHGRGQEENATSAARSVTVVKEMAVGLAVGRGERISSGIWNVKEEPLTLDEILPFSLQKIETMLVEALKIQAEVAEEEAPFNISPLRSGEELCKLVTSAKPLEEATKKEKGEVITMLVMVQARDPLRRYETVGGPVVVVIQANPAKGDSSGDEEERFKVVSLHVGGLRLKRGGGGDKQRLTAKQWVVAYGLGKAAGAKKADAAQGGKGPEVLWSISARVMADMWLKHVRNPDVKFQKFYCLALENLSQIAANECYFSVSKNPSQIAAMNVTSWPLENLRQRYLSQLTVISSS